MSHQQDDHCLEVIPGIHILGYDQGPIGFQYMFHLHTSHDLTISSPSSIPSIHTTGSKNTLLGKNLSIIMTSL